jgi:hypothetical protein
MKKKIPFIFKGVLFSLDGKEKLKWKNCSYRRMEKLGFFFCSRGLK